MPITSSFNRFYTGAQTGDRSQMAWGAVFLAIDVASFGEGSVLLKGASKIGLTNSQLVQKSAALAERAIGGMGPVAGTAKHKYASALLNRYQRIYGSRGLITNYPFNNGVGNRGILDVFDKTNQIIYDFKFGKAIMSNSQYNKYFDNFGVPIIVIRP